MSPAQPDLASDLGSRFLPDFLIVGAMKAGTSTLQAQLAAQPGLFMTTPKEPNFFSDDDIYGQGLEWYQDLFRDAGPNDLKGEASTHYTKLPTYPHTLARMAATLPAPRIVYVIRNPVDRLISHYMHNWTRGEVGHDMVQALQDHPECEAYSRYPMQIAPYLEQYGAHSVLLTSLEALKQDPDRELARVATHIGAPRPLVWDPDLKAQNVSSERHRPLPLHGLLVRNPLARALRHALVPQATRDRIKQARKPRAAPQLPPDLRARMQDRFAPDRDALARLFPDFDGLALSYDFVATQPVS